jgi:hypothetical protein
MRDTLLRITKHPSTLLIAILLLTTVVFIAHPAAAHAANSVNDARQGAGLTGSGGSGTSLSSVIKAIINVISAIVGVVAVIMIIIGGLKYVTSNGDSNNIASAKNTVLYAIVGLIVVAMAQVIVHFVIRAAS